MFQCIGFHMGIGDAAIRFQLLLTENKHRFSRNKQFLDGLVFHLGIVFCQSIYKPVTQFYGRKVFLNGKAFFQQTVRIFKIHGRLSFRLITVCIKDTHDFIIIFLIGSKWDCHNHRYTAVFISHRIAIHIRRTIFFNQCI